MVPAGDFPALLSPLEAGRLRLKNRVLFPGHQTLMSKDGVVGDRMFRYYLERARGGAAAIVVEGAAVHPTAPKFPEYLLAYEERIIPSLDRLADGLHEFDCRAIIQIAHSGSRMPSFDSQRPLWAPSDVRSAISPEIPHAMTGDEIDELLDGYAQTARTIARSRCDGIEIHSAHEYLLGQFLSPVNNRRTDDYGGSLENRMRMLLAVMGRVREAVGDERVVGVRINGSDLRPDGLQNEDWVEIARRIAATGLIDYINVSAGTSADNHMIVPPMDVEHGVFIDYAAAIKAAVDAVPVFGVGRVKTPEHAEAILAAGKVDALSIARALIADPEFMDKAATRPEQIRPCIGCNQGCFGNLYMNRPLTCTVNPAVGKEAERGLGTQVPAAPARRIAVVGGGPAGLEAAMTAAERGHDVVLFEASGTLGGQTRLGAAVPARAELADIVDHQAETLERLGVDVRLGVRATAATLAEEDVDAIVIATGSRPRPAELPGDGLPVLSPHEALAAAADGWAGQDVVVYDDIGHFPAYVPAETLADAGARVTLVTPRMVAGGGLDQATGVTMHRRLARKGVRFLPHQLATATATGGVRLRDTLSGEESLLPASALVAAIGNVAEDGLAAELRAAGREVHLVGDCVAPRTMTEAIREGRAAGRRL